MRLRHPVVRNLLHTVHANIISTGVSMLLFVLLPKFLTVEDYSYWQLFTLYASYASYLSFGLTDGAYLRYGGRAYETLPARFLTAEFYLLLFINILFLPLVLLTRLIPGLGEARFYVLILTVLSAVIVVPRSLLTLLFQATGRLKENAYTIILERGIYFILVLICLFTGRKTYLWLISAALVGRLISLLYCRMAAPPLFTQSWDFSGSFGKETIENMKAGLPLLFANLASMSIVGFVRFVVDGRWSIEVFGTISFTLSITNLFLLLMNSVGTVLYPLLRRKGECFNKELYLPLNRSLSFCLVWMLIFYFPVRYLLELWLPAYTEALHYLGLLFPMIVFECRNSLLNYTYMKTAREEKKLFLINVGSALLSLVLALVSSFLLSDLLLTILLMPCIVCLKTLILEYFIKKWYSVRTYGKEYVEIFLLFLFVICATWKSLWVGGLSYLGILLLYQWFFRKDALVSFRYLKNLIRS